MTAPVKGSFSLHASIVAHTVLLRKYDTPEFNHEHPQFTKDKWRQAKVSGTTRHPDVGYWEWVQEQLEGTQQ